MKYKVLSLQILIFFLLFELISISFGRKVIQVIFPLYMRRPLENIIGYPRFHFEANNQRGFDIAKSSKKILTSNMPSEGAPYYVWGNSLGCFDNDLSKDKNYQIYLAGDSFTWGYTEFKKKFGTLVESSLKKNIAKCGVTATGQRHQYDKFVEISKELKYFPPVVIVSVYENDVYDDFLYPSSTVYSGYIVGQRTLKKNGDNYSIIQLKDDEIKNKFLRLKKYDGYNSIYRKYDPRNWSSSFVVFLEIIKSIRDFQAPFNKDNKINSKYNLESNFNQPNLSAISNWIDHSKKNNYKLIFITIPLKRSNKTYYNELHRFIYNKGIESYDFEDYISKNNLEKGKLYWELDGHFNQLGNFHYAKFIESILKDEN